MVKTPNPLRIDPTRTTMLRKRFVAEMWRRFRAFRKAVVKLIVDEDAFGIKERRRPTIASISNQRWQPLSTDRQLIEFQQWVAGQVDDLILQGTDPASSRWLDQYIHESFETGQGRAFDDLRKIHAQPDEGLDFMRGSRDQFLSESFRHPPSVEKVRLLISRTFTDLQGVTQAMSTNMSRILADGLIQGDNVMTIARRMTREIDKMTRARAATIARTEVIRAHAEGELMSYKRLGVDKVGVMVEWSTAGDDRVCGLCSDLENVVMTLKEASGSIPRHPNCRCSFIPANVGEPRRGQIRSPARIEKAIETSVLSEVSRVSITKQVRTKSQRLARSRWSGADTKIAKVRPKDITRG